MTTQDFAWLINTSVCVYVYVSFGKCIYIYQHYQVLL